MAKTTGEVITQALHAYGVPFAAGIPGHGNWALVDAFADASKAPRFIQVLHEQSAMHMADACFRLTGTPGAATGSIGPGAANTLMGLATAFADSSAALLLTGSSASHVSGHGVMQSLDRKFTPDFPRLAEPATKAAFHLAHADMAASVMHRAFNSMLTGRPGPASIDIPLDVQVATTDIDVQDLSRRMPHGGMRPDSASLERTVTLLLAAARPCIVAGGGVLTARASVELRQVAEKLGAPVVYTWNGKGALPDDHALCIGPVGVGGSRAANDTASNADVLLALGCRFSDWSSSSFRKGVTFSIPPTKLIHIDIDPSTIGRSYPVEVGIVADVRLALTDLGDAVSKSQAVTASSNRAAYLEQVIKGRERWEGVLAARRDRTDMPASMLAILARIRRALPRDAVVTVGSGHCQAAVRQGFPVLEPGTHVTSGGYSSMGFAVPAAMASKVVRPDVPAVAIVGDGDFLMSAHELATCVMQNLPIIVLVLNNQGFLSIRDGQKALFGREMASEFYVRGSEKAYSPDFVTLARSFGLDFAERALDLPCLERLMRNAVTHNGPALIEVQVTRDPSFAGAEPSGWWDFPPMPTASAEILIDYEFGRAAQQHLGSDTCSVELRQPLGIYG
ncbi:thiamine pyrophosphate-binding protein [Allomesorhizobium camelthorni]|uniref:Thiamine pyrophosphate-binding protein n=1 Tax=Allomesorhizobium camelthorni TaxID=475069 RepID=A0A6G4WN99_9HYPH|nr:thiamine pyrophosphate-binding protein [Mesorhizobium camelthorni]NGO55673.1 thiamine pyrophosphate-binding protein [Mesorhizobium camelthorni]